MKKVVICIVCVMLCLVCSLVRAKTYLLPDWQGAKFDFEGDVSIDVSRCEELGYLYYDTGKCPTYYNQDTCVFNDKYLKCDGIGWCMDNGYTLSSCASPKVLNTQCPNGFSLYKYCVCPSTYKYTCNGTGYSLGKGTACDGKYTECTCANLYDWTGSACIHTHNYNICPSGYSTSSSGMISPASAAKSCACGATSGSCYIETHSHSYSCSSGYSTSSSSCSDGYSSTVSKVCNCGATSGTCYKCRICSWKDIYYTRYVKYTELTCSYDGVWKWQLSVKYNTECRDASGRVNSSGTRSEGPVKDLIETEAKCLATYTLNVWIQDGSCTSSVRTCE